MRRSLSADLDKIKAYLSQRSVRLALLTRTWYSASGPHQLILNPRVNHLALAPPPPPLWFIAFTACGTESCLQEAAADLGCSAALVHRWYMRNTVTPPHPHPTPHQLEMQF